MARPTLDDEGTPVDPDRLTGLRDVAQPAARIGADVVRRSARGGDETGELKGAGDYVTEVDRESEEAIRAFLTARAPGIPILGEEGGGHQTALYWAVDPLDGTTNFLLGFPAVAVSVALVADGSLVVAAVEAPLLGMSLSATRDGGAWSGGSRLAVSSRPPNRAIVATALPFRRKDLLPRYRPVLDRVFAAGEDIRRVGAAALDLAWVACGVWDGYFELNLGPWEVAAGALLVTEAGGVVTDWSGGPNYLGGDILAGSPQTHAMLLRAVSG